MRNLSSSLLVVLLGTSCVSSQTLKGDAKGAGAVVIDCAKANENGVVDALTPAFTNLFEGQKQNWSQTGDSLLNILGDVGACAANQGLQALEAKIASSLKPGMAVDTRPLMAAKAYVKSKKWNLKTK